MADIKTLDKHINELILSGKAIEAFDEFYADDVVMQENSDAPRVGKAVNRQYELDFFGSIEEFHGAELRGAAVDGERSYSEWTWDVTFKGGTRVQLNQVATRTYRDGKIAHERFYYAK